MTVTIAFIVFLYSILDILPLVFLKQAQNTVGESDFTYKAKAAENISETADYFLYNSGDAVLRKEAPSASSLFINYTEMNETIKGFDKFDGATPRWFGVADFSNPNNININTSGIVMILDTKNEVEIGLGRDFTKELLGAGQAFVIGSALRYLGIKANNQDKIRIGVDLREYLTLFYNTSNPLTVGDIETIMKQANVNLTSNQTIDVSAGDLFNVTQANRK